MIQIIKYKYSKGIYLIDCIITKDNSWSIKKYIFQVFQSFISKREKK